MIPRSTAARGTRAAPRHLRNPFFGANESRPDASHRMDPRVPSDLVRSVDPPRDRRDRRLDPWRSPVSSGVPWPHPPLASLNPGRREPAQRLLRRPGPLVTIVPRILVRIRQCRGGQPGPRSSDRAPTRPPLLRDRNRGGPLARPALQESRLAALRDRRRRVGLELQLAAPTAQLSRRRRSLHVPRLRTDHDRGCDGRFRGGRGPRQPVRLRCPRVPRVRDLVRALLSEPCRGLRQGQAHTGHNLGLPRSTTAVPRAPHPAGALGIVWSFFGGGVLWILLTLAFWIAIVRAFPKEETASRFDRAIAWTVAAHALVGLAIVAALFFGL